MATSSIYTASETVGLYGTGSGSNGTYFEWFIFYDSATAPATPTGGSWSFTTNSGTAPTGWLSSPPPSPTNLVWVSIAVVDSRSTSSLTWSTPGLLTGSGLPVLTGAGVPSAGTGLNTQLYLDTSTTPQSLYNKQSGTWVQITGSALYVALTGSQTIAGTKTFSSEIQGSISGNAGNVTGTVAVANGGTGSTTASGARTSLGVPSLTGTGASGSWGIDITGNAATATSAVSVQGVVGSVVGTTQTQTLTNKTISGSSNTITNIENASLVNDSVNINSVDFTLGNVQLVGPDWILPSYAGNAGKVLTVNPSASDVQWNVVSGTGTVTSVNVSGGTTGLTATGGPIVTLGTITLGGTLALANGGTGATTASGARGALGLGTAAELNAGVAGGVATLDGGGTVPTSQLPAAVLGALKYQGTWDANANSPTLASSVGTQGYYYVVSVAGSTNLNGITDWKIGDWAIYSGTAWQKIDNTEAVTSVNGYTGTVVLNYTDVGAFPATSTTGSGNVVLATGATQANPTISNYENFTPTAAPTYSEGRVWYDSTAKALAYYNDVASAVIHMGHDIQLKVINNTGSTIANGAPVYITSTSSGQTYPNVALARADVAATSAVIGLADGAIANGAVGYVTAQGSIDDVNTSSYTVGQVLYLSPYSAGQLMSTYPPTGLAVQVGVVTYVNSSTGKIYVKQTTPLAIVGVPIDNSPIGATTRSTGAFTTLTANADSSFTSTGAVQLSSGTTAQRPTGAAGKLRFNTTTAEFEGYNGTAWASVGGSAITNDTSTATNLYPLFAAATSGTASSVYTSNAQYLFKPSTGELSVKAPVAANGIVVNSDQVTSNYTIATGTNGFSVGPLTVASGVTLTVASGQRHVII